MIGYVTLGTNDFDKAAKFYDDLLTTLGAVRFMQSDRFIAWSVSPEQPALCIAKPFNEQNASAGNGTMVSLAVDSKEKVDQVYQKAMALGAADEGACGMRGDNFYAGYFRDLDGNKLNVFFMSMAETSS